MSKEINEEQLRQVMSDFQESVVEDLAEYVCAFTDTINCQVEIDGSMTLTITVPAYMEEYEPKTAAERSKMH